MCAKVLQFFVPMYCYSIKHIVNWRFETLLPYVIIRNALLACSVYGVGTPSFCGLFLPEILLC